MPTIEEEVEKYIDEGYVPEKITSRSAMLIKYKRFSGLWALAWYAVPSMLIFLAGLLGTGGPVNVALATGLLFGFVTLALYCVYFTYEADLRIHLFYNAGELLVREERVRSSEGDPFPRTNRERMTRKVRR